MTRLPNEGLLDLDSRRGPYEDGAMQPTDGQIKTHYRRRLQVEISPIDLSGVGTTHLETCAMCSPQQDWCRASGLSETVRRANAHTAVHGSLVHHGRVHAATG